MEENYKYVPQSYVVCTVLGGFRGTKSVKFGTHSQYLNSTKMARFHSHFMKSRKRTIHFRELRILNDFKRFTFDIIIIIQIVRKPHSLK